ncbi:protein of unknown function [Burkholderia multivorans]
MLNAWHAGMAREETAPAPNAKPRLESSLQHKFTQLSHSTETVSRKSSPTLPKKLTLDRSSSVVCACSDRRAATYPVDCDVRLNICTVNTSINATIYSVCGAAQRRRDGIG